MSTTLQRTVLLVALTVMTMGVVSMPALSAQEESARKVVQRVKPIYPAMARQLRLIGNVKLSLVVAPDGKVKSVKVKGGHPLLAVAAGDAAKQWQYASAPAETNELLTFQFDYNAGTEK